MTRAQVSRPATWSAAAVVAVLALGACGGDDDDAADDPSSATNPATSAAMVTTPDNTVAPMTQPTTPPATTAPALVTAGAKVVVANASTVDGAAGRMTDELAQAGFDMATATNASEDLTTTKVYYNASVPEAQAVANSIVVALGGGEITTEPLPTPAPLEDPETIADATVLVALGSDAADKTLAQLQGRAPTTTTPGTAAATTAPPTPTTAG